MREDEAYGSFFAEEEGEDLDFAAASGIVLPFFFSTPALEIVSSCQTMKMSSTRILTTRKTIRVTLKMGKRRSNEKEEHRFVWS